MITDPVLHITAWDGMGGEGASQARNYYYYYYYLIGLHMSFYLVAVVLQ
jgi:hypothetical protein